MFGPREYAVFAGALGAFWLLLTLAALFNRPRSAPGVTVFGHHWALRIIAGIVGPVLSLFFAVMAVVEPPNDRDWPIFAGFCAGFAVLGGLAYWETIRFAFALTPDGIDYVSPWRGRWLLPWASVRELGYTAGTFQVRSDAGTARVGVIVPRVGQLLEACERHLPAERLMGAIDGYSAVGRFFPYKGGRR